MEQERSLKFSSNTFLHYNLEHEKIHFSSERIRSYIHKQHLIYNVYEYT